MFGAFGAATTLFFSVLIRQWPQAIGHLRAEYQSFAEAVGGELQLEQPPVPFRFFGSFPRRVSFSHKGRDTMLEIVAWPGGDTTITYTRLTVALFDVSDFLSVAGRNGANIAARMEPRVGLRGAL